MQRVLILSVCLPFPTYPFHIRVNVARDEPSPWANHPRLRPSERKSIRSKLPIFVLRC